MEDLSTHPAYVPITTETPAAATSSVVLTRGQEYDFATREFVVPVNIAPRGSDPYWIYNRLRRAEREELSERERKAATRTKPTSAGKSRIITNTDEADLYLYGLIALGVRGLTGDDKEVQLTPELINQIGPGYRQAAIRNLYAGYAKLDWKPELAFFNHDPKRPLKVIYELGTRETPDFIIDFFMRRPDVFERADYRMNATEIETGGGGRRASTELRTNLEVTMRLFSRLFISVENATLNGQPFSEGLRDEFLAHIDPIHMSDIVAAVMEGEEGSGEV